ncbi:MAG: RES domain-containing protein [Gammaproteobacteria bacterium]|nr:MAG: RES domain-containing protein [Gammaproteobacteria bacterium]
MSTLKLRQKIKQLNSIDLDKVDYKYLVSLLWSASDGVQVPIQYKSIEIYFRARICNSKKIDKVSELGAPSADLITGYQRCNPPGIPMFYAASKRITALLECDVQEGDIVYLGQWINTAYVPINRIFSHSEMEMHNFSEIDILYHSFLETLFTRKIHKTFNVEYKLTAAATEALTTRYPKEETIKINGKIKNITIDGTGGLYYPSVTNKSNSYNTVFHANFANANLKLVHVTQLKITKKTDREYSIEIIDTTNETQDGNILWLGSRHSIPRQEISKVGVEFFCNGRDWIIPVRDIPLADDDISRFLNE